MFRFRLQSVLELRATIEKKSAAVLTQAREKASAARDEHAQLEDVLTKYVARLHGEKGGAQSVGELRSRSAAVARLEARVATAGEQVTVAETHELESDDAYQLAFRDRHVLDRLKDRYSTLWRLAAAKGELSDMDGVALARFLAAPPKHEEETT